MQFEFCFGHGIHLAKVAASVFDMLSKALRQ